LNGFLVEIQTARTSIITLPPASSPAIVAGHAGKASKPSTQDRRRLRRYKRRWLVERFFFFIIPKIANWDAPDIFPGSFPNCRLNFPAAFTRRRNQARYNYVYAVALNSTGRSNDAMIVLKDGLARHPANRDILSALVAFNRDAGDLVSSLEYAERLARLAPDNRNLANFVEELRRQIEKR
jgi:hypothetical protein